MDLLKQVSKWNTELLEFGEHYFTVVDESHCNVNDKNYSYCLMHIMIEDYLSGHQEDWLPVSDLSDLSNNDFYHFNKCLENKFSVIANDSGLLEEVI